MNNVQTPGGNTTTAGAVEMARRIAWEHWPSSHDFPERDAAEAAALAAIIETTEAAAKWLRRREAAHSGAFKKALAAGHEGHVDKFAAQSLALEDAAKAIERGDHLKGTQP